MDRIRALRVARGWSQADLAGRAGVTRQLVGAVEAGRHAPNVTAALGLARALGATVEELFDGPDAEPAPVVPVFGAPIPPGTPVSTARVGDALVAVPLRNAVSPSESWGLADATFDDQPQWFTDSVREGLVLAGCDPVLGLLGALVERNSAHRVVAAHASTGRSVAGLADGRVHGVLVHAAAGEIPSPPVPVRRWHVARWQVGLAAGRGSASPTLESILGRRVEVVQRDEGAASQRTFVQAVRALGASTAPPGPIGAGHLDVARRVADGGGDAGVTMEAAARAYDLAFSPLEVHEVELWVDQRWVDLPAVRCVLDQLDHVALRRRVAALGGYDLADCGRELSSVGPSVRERSTAR
ncbi:MAG: substrate-binding domain-containing protein [Ilumatobacteraceae bacterium]